MSCCQQRWKTGHVACHDDPAVVGNNSNCVPQKYLCTTAVLETKISKSPGIQICQLYVAIAHTNVLVVFFRSVV